MSKKHKTPHKTAAAPAKKQEGETATAQTTAPAAAATEAAPAAPVTAGATESEACAAGTCGCDTDTPAAGDGPPLTAQQSEQLRGVLGRQREERARRRATLFNRLPAGHPAAQVLAFSEQARGMHQMTLVIQGVRKRREGDPEPPANAPEMAKTHVRFTSRLFGRSQPDLVQQAGELMMRIFPKTQMTIEDPTHGRVASAEFRSLIETGQMILDGDEHMLISAPHMMMDRAAYNYGCRMLVQEFNKIVGKLYIQRVELPVGPDVTLESTLREYHKSCAAQSTLAGYMVAFESDGRFYLGASICPYEERVKGNLDRNREIWHAIRNAMCPVEVSARDEIADRANTTRDQWLKMHQQLLQYHIQDILSDLPKTQLEAYSSAVSKINQEIISARPSNHRFGLAKIEELRNQIKEASRAKPRRDDAIQSLESQLKQALELDDIETMKRTHILAERKIATNYSKCDTMTPEQVEVLSLLNQQLISANRADWRHYRKTKTKSANNKRPMPKGMTEPIDFEGMTAETFLKSFAYESQYTAMAETIRTDMEVEMRKTGWLPSASNKRMMSATELVAAIPGWGGHTRQPLLDFYSEKRAEHAAWKNAEAQRAEAATAAQTASTTANTPAEASTEQEAVARDENGSAVASAGSAGEGQEVAAAAIASSVSEDQSE